MLQDGSCIASKAGEDEGRKAICLGTASGAGMLRQQPTRRMRIAEHALGNEGRIQHRDVGTRRHECRNQLRVVSLVGKDKRRAVARHTPLPIGIGLGV